MNRFLLTKIILALLSIALFVGCGGSSSNDISLNEKNINLVFVVSPDLQNHTDGDIQLDTANLTSQGLNRSLQLATYLKEIVLSSKNVDGIYALSPMTHLQTENNYPDMTAIGYIQEFAMLNESTLAVGSTTDANGNKSLVNFTANSFPIKVSYESNESIPDGVSKPPSISPNSVGLDYNSVDNNYKLASDIIEENSSGFYVFSAPWDTIYNMMNKINTKKKYNLEITSRFDGSNYIYAISIPTSNNTANLTVYNADITPSTNYPSLAVPLEVVDCNHTYQVAFTSVRIDGEDNVSVPTNANTNQTVYFVRHAEAHSDENFKFENGNFVAAGQWRALDLSNILMSKITMPDMVYSIDPAQWFHAYGDKNFSYIRPSLTVLPFVIANNLPYSLVADFQLDTNATNVNAKVKTSDFFFTGGKFSNKTILVAWESGHIRPMLNQLLATYGGNSNLETLDVVGPPVGGWNSQDYNTIWRVTLDNQGNLTVDNDLCEGINSRNIPVTAPQFPKDLY